MMISLMYVGNDEGGNSSEYQWSYYKSLCLDEY